jgi:histidinol phosphatase-like enzyme
MKKTIIFDFDGVIHEYKSSWIDSKTITDNPVYGIKTLIIELRKKYKIIVVSSRCATDEGMLAIKAWLKYHSIEVDGILKEKPPAFLTIDDRCICFDGNMLGDNMHKLIEKINNFKPWNKK